MFDMDIYVYSDESGVFDVKNNEYFVFGGLMFLSFDEADRADRLYRNAENIVRRNSGLTLEQEAKACRLSNADRAKLFRSMNHFYKFGVVVHQNKVLSQIFDNKKSKQRYLDYAFKIVVKRQLEKLIGQNIVVPKDVSRIRIYVDEHATATDGRYELRESLEQEFRIGTFNQKWNQFFPPIFPLLQSVELKFCDSKTRTLIRAADIVANRIYFSATSGDLTTLRGRKKMLVIELP